MLADADAKGAEQAAYRMGLVSCACIHFRVLNIHVALRVISESLRYARD